MTTEERAALAKPPSQATPWERRHDAIVLAAERKRVREELLAGMDDIREDVGPLPGHGSTIFWIRPGDLLNLINRVLPEEG